MIPRRFYVDGDGGIDVSSALPPPLRGNEAKLIQLRDGVHLRYTGWRGHGLGIGEVRRPTLSYKYPADPTISQRLSLHKKAKVMAAIVVDALMNRSVSHRFGMTVLRRSCLIAY